MWVHKIKAVVSITIALTVILMLFSYNPFDNSLNMYADLATSNFLGKYGAYGADILLQLFGLGAYSIALIFGIFSILFWNNKIENIGYRWILSILTLCSISSLAHLILKAEELPASSGGILGNSINKLISVSYYYKILIFGSTTLISIVLITEYSIFNIFKTLKISLKQKTKSNNNSQKGTKTLKSKDSGVFVNPNIDLLNKPQHNSIKPEILPERASSLMQALQDFGIKGKINGMHQGPVVSLYEFEPAAGIKSARVIGLADDIARSLGASSARISILSGKNALGIELPNQQRAFFSLRELIETDEYLEGRDLPLILGKDINGKPIMADLAKMPHLLVAGTTGSGKSVGINAMIISLLYKYAPSKCKFIMIDPKMLELSVYDGIPHLLTPVVTDSKKAVTALKWAVKEMENRYRLMSNIGVRNIFGYNDKISEALDKKEKLERKVQIGFNQDGTPEYHSESIPLELLPLIVVIVDEMADLMLVAGKEIESYIQRLAQMARAAGIHLIMATQRPSVDVITGVIKANFPSRLSFKVTSKIDSRTILGEMGAEQLLGMGDMLYMGNGQKIIRVHGPFVSDIEVERVVNFLKSQEAPNYMASVTEADEDAPTLLGGDEDDNLYNQALNIVKQEKRASISYIQRCLRIGYNRAAILVERMEKEGILSTPNHTGRREILVQDD